MTLAQSDWAAITSLSGDELRARLFSVIQDAALDIQEGEIDNPSVLSSVPRIADLIATKSELTDFSEMFSALARSTGLWNYIDKEHADARDQLIAEAVTVPALGDITLHREQIAALNVLLAGTNLILSAPTSFGKSLLIDALLLTGRYRRIAIVLPTIALLDECRRRLVARFGNTFDVIMHHSDVVQRDHIIFLGTQERLINRDDLGMLDLVVVDEFYKLDPQHKDERSIVLNAAVYQLLRKAAQFFFLGPNIEAVQISADSRWRFEFLKTRFSTVAVDTYDLKAVRDKETRLQEEAFKESNWPVLIFVSSPDKANRLASKLVQTERSVGSGERLARWIELNYGGKWELGDAVEAGIGVHHGRIPRALSSRFVKMFNDGELPILICTSTLIEGVNTAAKSVLIFDKTIARENYDYFTYSNIRGRAGRLGQHHVGKVFLFHAPPGQQDVEVTAPLFGDLENVPDEFVIHISDEDASPAINERVDDLTKRLGLSADELRRVASLGIDNLEALRVEINQDVIRQRRLGWSARADYDDIRAVCEVICSIRSPQGFGVGSANQLTMYLHQLRRSATMRDFFIWHSTSYRGDTLKLDNVFRFLRACEFSLPEWFSAVQLFARRAGITADYALFIAGMLSWFRPQILKNLEEEGVPIQISERFYRNGDTSAQLTARLQRAAGLNSDQLSEIEQGWILDAVPISQTSTSRT